MYYDIISCYKIPGDNTIDPVLFLMQIAEAAANNFTLDFENSMEGGRLA